MLKTATVRWFSFLRGIKKYRGSQTQYRLHKFTDDSQTVRSIRQSIDLTEMHKISQAKITIRQFIFQEKQPAIQVNFEGKDLLPVGKWTNQDLNSYLDQQPTVKTVTEAENEEILDSFEDQLIQRINAYYLSLGKNKPGIKVSEEVEKIAAMTEVEFSALVNLLQSYKRNNG